MNGSSLADVERFGVHTRVLSNAVYIRATDAASDMVFDVESSSIIGSASIIFGDETLRL